VRTDDVEITEDAGRLEVTDIETVETVETVEAVETGAEA
jgi:hypothetical protein